MKIHWGRFVFSDSLEKLHSACSLMPAQHIVNEVTNGSRGGIFIT